MKRRVNISQSANLKIETNKGFLLGPYFFQDSVVYLTNEMALEMPLYLASFLTP